MFLKLESSDISQEIRSFSLPLTGPYSTQVWEIMFSGLRIRGWHCDNLAALFLYLFLLPTSPLRPPPPSAPPSSSFPRNPGKGPSLGEAPGVEGRLKGMPFFHLLPDISGPLPDFPKDTVGPSCLL